MIDSLGDLIGPPPYGPAGYAVEGCLWKTVFPGSMNVDCAPGHYVDRTADRPIPSPTAGWHRSTPKKIDDWKTMGRYCQFCP